MSSFFAIIGDGPAAFRMLAFGVSFPVAALLLSALARWEVLRLSEGTDEVPIGRTAAAAALAGTGAVLLQGPGVSFADMMIPAAILVLVAAAVVDRNLAWAPDSLMVPLAVLCGGIAALRGGLPAWAGILAGPVLLLTLYKLDAVLRHRIPGIPTPPDLLAFAAGPALLGFGVLLLVVLGLAMLALLAIRLHPPLVRMVARPEAAEAARQDLGYDENAGPAVPLLGILFPLYAVGLAISIVAPWDALFALSLFFSQMLR